MDLILRRIQWGKSAARGRRVSVSHTTTRSKGITRHHGTVFPGDTSLSFCPTTYLVRNDRESARKCAAFFSTSLNTPMDPSQENTKSPVADNDMKESDDTFLQTHLSIEEESFPDESILQQQTFLLDLDTLEKKTLQILDKKQCPVGSMDYEAFEEARQVIMEWTKVKSMASVQHCFDLLERLILEQGSNFHSDLADQQVAQLLNAGLVTAIVKNWHGCFEQQQEEIDEQDGSIETISPSRGQVHATTTTTTTTTITVISPPEMLAKMDEWAENYPNLSPQTKAISTIMLAIVNRMSTVEEAIFVESLLVRLVEQFRAGINRMTPTIAEYNIAMHALAKVKEPERAEAILFKLCDDYDEKLLSGLKPSPLTLKPSAFTFGVVLHAWRLIEREDSGRRAQIVLDRMIDFGQRHDVKELAKPNEKCYYSVLSAYCTPKVRSAMQQGEAFLRRMYDDYHTKGIDGARPTDSFFEFLIRTWSMMGCAEDSERVLRWMYNDCTHGSKDEEFSITCRPFNYAISAWAKSGEPQALQRVFSLYQTMQQLNVSPDAITFGELILGLSRSNDQSTLQQAGYLLEEQKRLYRAGNQQCKPDVLNYNAAMHCWSLLGNSERAVELLWELITEHKKGTVRITDDRPFITAIASLSRSNHHRAVDVAESLFKEMVLLGEAGVLEFQPTANAYNALQGCWASAERPDSGDKCLSLLQKMQARFVAGDKTLQTSEANYKTVIDAYARIRNPVRAQEVWHDMLQSFLNGNNDAKPGNESCKAVLASWLMSDDPEAIQKALDLIDRIAEVDQSDTIELKINQDTYHLLLDICSKSKNRNVTAGADTIVRKMKEIHNLGHGAVGPDAKCYNIAINCLGKVGNAERAEALFWEMYNEYVQHCNHEVKPDRFSISSVLSAWAKSRSTSATRRAEVFFDRISKLIELEKLENVKLDSVCYAAFLNCLGKSKTEEAADRAESVFSDIRNWHQATGDKHVRPTETCYFALVRCLTQVDRVDRAEQIIFEMHGRFTDGEKDLRPKREICFRVLRAWLVSDSEEAPVRAEKMLHWMDTHLNERERPDPLDYANVLNCWARSRRPDSGQHCEDILLKMAERFGASRPLVKKVFSDVICAWARSGNVKRAEELLLRGCDDNPGKSIDDPATPSLRSFVAVLAALSRSNPPDVARRTLRLIEKLRVLDDQNHVIACWNAAAIAQHEADKKRLKDFLAEMENLDAPTHSVAYANSEDKADLAFALKY